MEVLCSVCKQEVIKDALRIAGHAAIHLEPIDAAIAAQENLAAIASDQPQVLNDLGGLLCQAGRYDDAEAALRGALALMPGDSHTLANLGQVHLEGPLSTVHPWKKIIMHHITCQKLKY